MTNIHGRTIGTLIVAVIAWLAVAIGAQAQDKVDLSGAWTLTVETAAGSGTPTFVFKQTGEKLEGTYEGQLGKADITGTVKGNAAKWTFSIDQLGTVEYSGTLEKDTLKGTVRLGELGEGTFTGTRKK
jgi:hypothetical protein